MMNLPTVARSSGATRLAIGEVAALTGIRAGRIRHYEATGLLAPVHSPNGYRSFGAADVLRLLHIDLLRSMGMGLAEIRGSLSGAPRDLRPSLERHRDALRAERRRIDRLLGAVDAALEEPSGEGEAVLGHLALAHRESLGVFGRLARPLSPGSAAAVTALLGADWDLPVPALFGQMLLPDPVTDLLEALVAAGGHADLFDRLRALAARILALDPDSPGQPEDVGRAWVRDQVENPPDAEVVAVLRRYGPAVAALPVMGEGLALWAGTISEAAPAALRAMHDEARALGASIAGALVIPPAG